MENPESGRVSHVSISTQLMQNGIFGVATQQQKHKQTFKKVSKI